MPPIRVFRSPLTRAGFALGGALAAILCGLLPGPPGPALVGPGSPTMAVLAILTLIGLVAGFAAHVSVSRQTPTSIALLSALLVPALAPGLSAAVLLPALILSLVPARRTHVVAILVQCSAITLLLSAFVSAFAAPAICFASAIVVLACGVSARSCTPKAANDNPHLARTLTNRRLLTTYPHVTFASSNPGNWGISHVQ